MVVMMGQNERRCWSGYYLPLSMARRLYALAQVHVDDQDDDGRDLDDIIEQYTPQPEHQSVLD